MRKISLIAMLFFAAATPVCAHDAATGFWAVLDNCQNYKLDPDIRIKMCTEIIHSNILTHSILSAIYNDRAEAYSDKGDTESALNDFAKAIEFKPDLAALYANRGEMLMHMGRTADAILDSDHAGFLNLLQGDCKDGINVYSYVLKNDPKNAAALYGRGICEKRNGDDKAAQTDQDAAIAIDPSIAQKYDWPS